MFLKKRIDGVLHCGQFELSQGEDWIELSQEEINQYLLEKERQKKLESLERLRDEELLKPAPQTITYGGNLSNKTFSIKSDDVFRFGNIIAMLERSGGTRNWTDANGGRVALGVDDYRSLRNHLLVRDETIYNLYAEKKAAIEACQTLEELEQIELL